MVGVGVFTVLVAGQVGQGWCGRDLDTGPPFHTTRPMTLPSPPLPPPPPSHYTTFGSPTPSEANVSSLTGKQFMTVSPTDNKQFMTVSPTDNKQWSYITLTYTHTGKQFITVSPQHYKGYD
ncbi:hypothetical protein Pcinc_013451 [Petrolisthes cinctipes]|uniref:Uncharacterized protein n=1 Tax=Petrolisthes cinctipes TaxID=88211 RepID=A0AAE1FYM1_PETCI|nr:hypothetical protein Pcinc_013451 [Petrolisthes cinctipes]